MHDHDKILPADLRERAVRHLQSVLTDQDVEYLRELYARTDGDWGDEITPEQHADNRAKYGFTIPSPFHFSGGLQIRNILRLEIADDELPPIDYNGEPMQNWDDYYTAVLEEAIGVFPPEGKKLPGRRSTYQPVRRSWKEYRKRIRDSLGR